MPPDTWEKKLKGNQTQELQTSLPRLCKVYLFLEIMENSYTERLMPRKHNNWRRNPKLEQNVLMSEDMRNMGHGRCSSPKPSSKLQEGVVSCLEDIIISSRGALLHLWNVNWCLSHGLMTFLSHQQGQFWSGSHQGVGRINQLLSAKCCMFVVFLRRKTND